MTQRTVLGLKAFVPGVLYLTDPIGVLWHNADRRTSSDQ
jgi:hypothetical protein